MSMKKIMLVLSVLLMSASVSGYSEEIKEEVLGHVVAVKRSFGFASYEACQKVFKPFSSSGFGCDVNLPDPSKFVHNVLRWTYREATIDICKVTLGSSSRGYTISVSPTNYSSKVLAQFTQTFSLECVKNALLTTDMGTTEITSVVLDVK
ncbi:MAG: hypothetical protein HY843_00515 [Bdellovibrio sp.]|nr:hypothetical protein [Bdellovibrio sp.]